MKKIVLLGALIVLQCRLESFYNAQIWADQVCAGTHQICELNAVLNVVYWSYMRSKSTLDVQKVYAQYSEHCLKIGQNIHDTRRNSSKTIAYPQALFALGQVHDTFVRAVTSYHTTLMVYNNALGYCIDTDSLISQRLKNSIIQLRKQARKSMAHAMVIGATSFMVSFDSLNNLIKNPPLWSSKKSNKKLQGDSSRSLLTVAIKWACPIAMKAFVKCDNEFNVITEHWWKLLLNAYKLDNGLWEILETARSSFYYNHYCSLYKKMKQLYEAQSDKSERDFFAIIFDDRGLISSKLQKELLPEL